MLNQNNNCRDKFMTLYVLVSSIIMLKYNIIMSVNCVNSCIDMF